MEYHVAHHGLCVSSCLSISTHFGTQKLFPFNSKLCRNQKLAWTNNKIEILETFSFFFCFKRCKANVLVFFQKKKNPPKRKGLISNLGTKMPMVLCTTRFMRWRRTQRWWRLRGWLVNCLEFWVAMDFWETTTIYPPCSSKCRLCTFPNCKIANLEQFKVVLPRPWHICRSSWGSLSVIESEC